MLHFSPSLRSWYYGLLMVIGIVLPSACLAQDPMPVELMSFDASCQGRDVTLTWATASERGNSYFAIEASCDGRSFRDVGQVPGHGTTTQQQNYRFQALAVTMPGTHQYYRLRQVGTNGYQALSDTRPVTLTPLPLIAQVVPNPFYTTLALTLAGSDAPTAQLTLTDMTGHLAWQQPVALAACDLTPAAFDLSGLRKGFYILTATAGTQRQRVRVVKL